MNKTRSQFWKELGQIVEYCKTKGIAYALGNALTNGTTNFESVQHKKALYITHDAQSLIEDILFLDGQDDENTTPLPVRFEKSLADGVYSYLLVERGNDKVIAEAYPALIVWGTPKEVWSALSLYAYGQKEEFDKVAEEAEKGKGRVCAYIFGKIGVFKKPKAIKKNYDLSKTDLNIDFTYIYELPFENKKNTREITENEQ